jgi:hypothetical protein
MCCSRVNNGAADLYVSQSKGFAESDYFIKSACKQRLACPVELNNFQDFELR